MREKTKCLNCKKKFTYVVTDMNLFTRECFCSLECACAYLIEENIDTTTKM